jgi:hypothetical protein
MNNCQDCDGVEDNTVILWAFGGHDIYEELRRRRKKAWEKIIRQKRRQSGY